MIDAACIFSNRFPTLYIALLNEVPVLKTTSIVRFSVPKDRSLHCYVCYGADYFPTDRDNPSDFPDRLCSLI